MGVQPLPTSTGEHIVVIERRGTAHTARCGCGWAGHPWNELRPAEADAWHHTYGDSRVVEPPPPARQWPPPGAAGADWTVVDGGGSAAAVGAGDPGRLADRLVNRARALADGPSPHRPGNVDDLAAVAGGDMAAVSEALGAISDALRRHSQRSAAAADDEWLRLHTARRLLQAVRDTARLA